MLKDGAWKVYLRCFKSWGSVRHGLSIQESEEDFCGRKKGSSSACTKMDSAHSKTVEEVLAHLKVSEEEGLTPETVVKLREQYGLNGE